MTAKQVVFLSAYHDYRTPKRASIQQVADGLVCGGYDVSFISTRFSRLSKLTGDSRLFLWDRANVVEQVNGIRCYLWRTFLHPFASRRRALNVLMNVVYPLYANLRNPQVDKMLKAADYVIIESSVAAIALRHIRKMAPAAKVIYYATDRLDTVGAHPYIMRRLALDAHLIDHVCIRSPKMASEFQWAKDRLYRAEFGINEEEFSNIGPSPYGKRKTAVSVGSMLFDETFFQIAAPEFPEIDFHVIGCGTSFDAPKNVIIHPEMKFKDTLPFVKHATIGVAPYCAAPGVEYLAESSLKLAQYEVLALPAVCPHFAAGNLMSRSGYQPNDPMSISLAIRQALTKSGNISSRSFLSWNEVAERVLIPENYPDAKISN